MGRGERGAAGAPPGGVRGAAGTGLVELVACGHGAKAAPEMSSRLPVCGSAAGRQITLFKGELSLLFTQHRLSQVARQSNFL